MLLVLDVVFLRVACVAVQYAKGLKAGDTLEAEEVVDSEGHGEALVRGLREGETFGEGDGVFDGLGATVAR